MDLFTLIQALSIPREPGSAGLTQVRDTIDTFIEEINIDFVKESDKFTAKPPDPFEETEFENLIYTYKPQNSNRRLILARDFLSIASEKRFSKTTLTLNKYS